MNTLDLEVYKRYYQAAKERGIVWTVYDWYSQRDPEATEEEIENFIENFEHCDALQKLLAYEISIFVFRRLNGPWGEIIDFFKGELCRFANEYREATGFQLEGNLVDYY